MFQPTLIHTVLDWEHRLEIDEQRRAQQRHEAYANYLAPVNKPRRSIISRPKNTPAPRPASPAVRPLECCGEPQAS